MRKVLVLELWVSVLEMEGGMGGGEEDADST